MRRTFLFVLTACAALAVFQATLLSNSQKSAGEVTIADPLPCVVIDAGTLGVDRVITVCPHIG